MIFVQPAYLPSVNYFKDFNDNDVQDGDFFDKKSEDDVPF